MNTKACLLLFSIVSFSADLYSKLPDNLAPLVKTIKNSDYERCKYLVDKAKLTSDHKDELLEIANRQYQERDMAYADRSHGLVRFVKFFVYGGIAIGSAVTAGTTGGMVVGNRAFTDFNLLKSLEPVAVPVAIGSLLVSILSSCGVSNAVFGPGSLDKKRVNAEHIKNLIESKKVFNA